MVVCVCHNINDRKVNEAITAGAKTPREVLNHYNCSFKCGRCIPMMYDLLEKKNG